MSPLEAKKITLVIARFHTVRISFNIHASCHFIVLSILTKST